ncbi:MAG: hypothetical protein GY854_25385 [Deltaproteobacteria bacterium]|nr:hypothetical protein [Deltaproteobacteria bacterium]
MADRVNFFFRQRVTEAELDVAFELLEKADRDLASDIGVYGIISGASPVQHSPVADLTIDLVAPARAYDRLGQRIFFGSDQRVDCAADYTGIPTDVSTAGNERRLAVFLAFDRIESDPRTDGNSQQVYFRRDEAFQIKVRQAPEGPAGAAPLVPLEEDELLVCDILRTAGQTQIFDANIDTSRRQSFIFATGNSLEIISGLWSTIQPAVDTVQAAFDSVDEVLTGHLDGSDDRHPAGDIDYAPHGFVAAGNVQSAIDEVVDDLSSASSGTPGASLVGADAVPGTPHGLPGGNVDGQLSQILVWLNDHIGALGGAHNASAIAASSHNYITGASVQSQLQEIVDVLERQTAPSGAIRIGNNSISDTPNNLSSGTLRAQLVALLSHLNTHIGSADHDSRYYNVGSTVSDSDRVDGQHASAFAASTHSHSAYALASHDHDSRYPRAIDYFSNDYTAGQAIQLATYENPPEFVYFTYDIITASGPSGQHYIHGAWTRNVLVHLREIVDGTGDKDYELWVTNNATSSLQINVNVFFMS